MTREEFDVIYAKDPVAAINAAYDATYKDKVPLREVRFNDDARWYGFTDADKQKILTWLKGKKFYNEQHAVDALNEALSDVYKPDFYTDEHADGPYGDNIIVTYVENPYAEGSLERRAESAYGWNPDDDDDDDDTAWQDAIIKANKGPGEV